MTDRTLPPWSIRWRFAARPLRLFLASLVTAAALSSTGYAQEAQQHPLGPEVIIRSTDKDAEANRLFNQANALLRQGKAKEAYQAYLVAWDARRTFEVAVNLGLLELSLDKPRDAAEHLNLALLNAPRESPPALLDQLKRALTEAKTKIGTVAVSSNESGDLLVDGERQAWIDSDKPTEVFLVPGSRRLVLRKEGYEGASQTVEIAKGSALAVSLTLTKRAAVPPTAAGPTPPPPPAAAPSSASSEPSRSVVPVVVGGVLVAAGLAIGIGATLAANGNANDAQNLRTSLDAQSTPQQVATSSVCYAPSGALADQCAALKSALISEDHAHNLAVAGFVGAGVALVGTAAYLVFWPKPKPQPAAALQLHPIASASSCGLLWSGSF